MSESLLELLRQRRDESFALHERYLNTQHARVLRTIGFDRRYVRAEGPYLWDDAGEQYLDLLSGYGVFAVGRNHPAIVTALREVLEGELPSLVQMDVSLLAGILAQRGDDRGVVPAHREHAVAREQVQVLLARVVP